MKFTVLQSKLPPIYPHSRGLQPPVQTAHPILGLCRVIKWKVKPTTDYVMINTQIGWRR